MKRLLIILALLAAAPAFAQRPSVFQQTVNPDGTACTYGTSPVVGYNDGTTLRWYYCADSTDTYQVLGSGIGDMLRSAYDPNTLGGVVVLRHATNCASYSPSLTGGKTYLCYQDSNNGVYGWDQTDAAWTLISGGGTGDMTKAVYDTNANNIIDVAALANSVDWSSISNRPTGLNDGDNDTKDSDGVIIGVGQVLLTTGVSPLAWQGYTPQDCVANVCALNPGTVVDTAGPGTQTICLGNGTGCPSGQVDTGPVPSCTIAGDTQLHDGTCADPLLSSEMNSFFLWRTQVGITGTPDGTKFIRDDGSLQPVATTFTSATDVPDSYVGNGGKMVRVKSTVDGVEFVNIAKADLTTLGQVAYKDEENTFANAQRITNSNPIIKLRQSDGTNQNVWLDLEGSQLRLSSYTDADALSTRFGIFNTAAPTNSFVQDASGNLGIGTASPSQDLHVFRASEQAGIRIDSDTNEAVAILDGNRASDGQVSYLSFMNNNNNNALIQSLRTGAAGTATLDFQTATTGTLATRMNLSSSALTLGTGVGLAMASNNITGGGAATFAGTVTAGALSIPGTATGGQYVQLAEDTDNGASTYTLSLGASNLTGNVTCTIDANGRIPDSCVGDGTDGGGAGGSGDPNYIQSFTSQTSVSLTHALGTPNVIVACYDANGAEILPSTKTIGASPYNVDVTFSTAQTGSCVVNGFGFAGGAELNDLEAGTQGVADDEVFVGNAANAGTYTALQNCTDGTQSLDWNGTAFVCNNISAATEINDLEGTDPSSILDDETYVGNGGGSGTFTALQNCTDGTATLDWTGTAFICNNITGAAGNFTPAGKLMIHRDTPLEFDQFSGTTTGHFKFGHFDTTGQWSPRNESDEQLGLCYNCSDTEHGTRVDTNQHLFNWKWENIYNQKSDTTVCTLSGDDCEEVLEHNGNYVNATGTGKQTGGNYRFEHMTMYVNFNGVATASGTPASILVDNSRSAGSAFNRWSQLTSCSDTLDKIVNVTDGNSCTVTACDATSVTCGAGGMSFDVGDVYEVTRRPRNEYWWDAYDHAYVDPPASSYHLSIDPETGIVRAGRGFKIDAETDDNDGLYFTDFNGVSVNYRFNGAWGSDTVRAVNIAAYVPADASDGAALVSGISAMANLGTSTATRSITSVRGATFDMNYGSASNITIGTAYAIEAKQGVGTIGSNTITQSGGISVNSPPSGLTTANQFGIIVADQRGVGSSATDAIAVSSQTSFTSGTKGNIRMVGGGYDTGHLQLATGHIWWSGSTLRAKASAPTSASDGFNLLAPYVATLSATTSLSVTAATHLLGHDDIHVTCYDNATPQARVEPDNVTVTTGGDVVITFAVAQSGKCVLG